MEYPEIVLNHTQNTNSEHIETEHKETKPVYVYGASGRCWKFNNKKNFDDYWDKLVPCRQNLYPFIKNLFDKLGTDIIERLRMVLNWQERKTNYERESFIFYHNTDSLTKIKFEMEVMEYSGEMTDKNGRKVFILPSKFKFFHKFSNITIITENQKFGITDFLNMIVNMMSQPKVDIMGGSGTRNTLFAILNINDLYFDYIKGDMKLYDKPRSEITESDDTNTEGILFVPPPEQTYCFGLRKRKNEYDHFTPMNLTIDGHYYATKF